MAATRTSLAVAAAAPPTLPPPAPEVVLGALSACISEWSGCEDIDHITIYEDRGGRATALLVCYGLRKPDLPSSFAWRGYVVPVVFEGGHDSCTA
jgi:hypothetical protein